MPKRNYKVKSVIFDMDGVITNTMPDHFRAWKRIFDQEGVNVTQEDIYSREGQKGFQSIKEIFAKYQRPFCPDYARELLDRKEEYFRKIVRIRFVTGTRRLLRNLKKKNIQLALVTGTSYKELLEILPESIRELFSVIITGCAVTHGKPHPQPYRKSLEALGILPHEAVVIENAPFGIQSAKAAGLPCMAISTSLSKEYLHEADEVFANMKDLVNTITFQPMVSL